MSSLLETTDFDIPFTTDDAVIECGACDPEYGEPADWPAWTDLSRFEPTSNDVAWLNAEPFEPTDADWDDLYAASYGITDDDLAAAGLAVG